METSWSWKTTFVGAVVAVLALAAAPAAADAQGRSGLSADVRGGFALPAGDLADLTDIGPSMGTSIRYRVHPRVDVRLDGELDLLSGLEGEGGEAATPDVELWRALAGADVHVPGTGRALDLAAHLQAGLTSYNTGIFPEIVFEPGTGEPVGDFAETYLTLAGGIELGYSVLRSAPISVDLVARGSWTTMLSDEEETAIFGQLRSAAGGFGRASTVPVTLGLRLAL